MKRIGRVHVGCSGWQYQHWRGDFYPAELPTLRWSAHYALTFDTVEVNNSIYRLPEAETLAKWRDQAPPRFGYAVKASRFLTHMKKLKDPEDPLRRFSMRARHLGSHLGPILYQLPPRWPLNLERFEIFLRALSKLSASAEGSGETSPKRSREGGPAGLRHVVEFREPSWYDDRVFSLLEYHRVALCLHDMQGAATDTVVIGPFVYTRFHFGTQKYGGRYDDRRLDQWAGWLADSRGERSRGVCVLQQRHRRARTA